MTEDERADDDHAGTEQIGAHIDEQVDDPVEDERLQVIDSDSTERFYRAMTEQSLRATKFEHRMRTSRMRHLLTGSPPVIDLTTTAERPEPVPRD